MNLGRFYFLRALLYAQPELFLPVFAEMVIVDAFLMPEGSIEFTALSNRFDAFPDGQDVPQYNVTPTTHGVDVVRVDATG